jgi:hypothetical protein
MDTLESHMTALAAADAPAAHDPVFVHAVMARIARRQQRGALMVEGALVLGGSLALAAAAPLLAQVSREALNFTGVIAVAALLTLVGMVPAWWLTQQR